MGAEGLIAVIVTLHEVALGLAFLVFASIAVLGAVLLRGMPPARRAFTVCLLAAGSGLLSYGVTARLADVTALDLEVVRVDGPP